MLLISPNLDVMSIIFPDFGQEPFPKLLEEPCFRDPLMSNIIQHPLTGDGIYWVLPFKKFEIFKHFFFYSQIKSCLHVSGLEVTKCLSAYQTEKTQIRLLLQKQSDLGLHCLSLPF